MASSAYQPNKTQTPFMGILRSKRDGGLQVDDLLINYEFDFIARDAHVPELGEQNVVPIAEWPERVAFKSNVAKWMDDSLFDSLPDRMRRHESYQAIIAQGERVVPLIASELRRNPSFLFLALEDITRSDPVPPEAEGDLRATVAAWLSWLRK